jgi:hypothetical protein
MTWLLSELSSKSQYMFVSLMKHPHNCLVQNSPNFFVTQYMVFSSASWLETNINGVLLSSNWFITLFINETFHLSWWSWVPSLYRYLAPPTSQARKKTLSTHSSGSFTSLASSCSHLLTSNLTTSSHLRSRNSQRYLPTKPSDHNTKFFILYYFFIHMKLLKLSRGSHSTRSLEPITYHGSIQ